MLYNWGHRAKDRLPWLTCRSEIYVMQFPSLSTTKYSTASKRLVIWTAAFLLFVIGILMYSKTAHAGLISYMQTMFGGGRVSAKVIQNQIYSDSRNLALLHSAVSYDPNPEKPSGVSPVVGNTLVADAVLSEAVEDTTSTQISSYTVRDGDTISGIAKMFGVSVNTVMWANNISRASALRVGQDLIILPVTGINYTLQKGDTIKGIALKYKADVDEILRYNDLSLNSTLIVGQNIIIPDAELQIVVPTKGVVKNNPAHNTNGPDYGNYYIRPVQGGVKTQGLHGYNGIDIASPVGTPIYASAAGKVLVSISGGWNGGYGNLVIISHDNGTQTLYSHLSKNLVKVGQYVEQNQRIAFMGATGKVTGPHLHFEIRGAKNPF
ncbi:MAG: hypothetical protein A3C79_02990 [Candidatus Taylorbacteria bacterium RIFCSPHIGHO2_02_FULL_45_28]|nr:MAG: hypothetical protein A3C79_02990 [Candidatus Taylorbacteria bacterium RIFCSPHIGHO2_02_FULL_45_28]